MQCEKEIGPVDAPNVTAFSEQCDDVSRMIDFHKRGLLPPSLAAFTPIHCTERNPLLNEAPDLQEQSALRSLRQQMDVWFRRTQESVPGGIRCALSILEMMTCTLCRACPGHPCPRLTDDLHGGRLIRTYHLDEKSPTRTLGN
jgi:hypothetical protein